MSQVEREIIVVEDDTGMSQAIERLLGAAGWRSRLYSSAEDFIKSGSTVGADTYIFDLNLPGMSGIELHRQLSAAGSVAPVIYITGQDLPKNRSLAREHGAIAYFVKPFAGVELIEAIRRGLPAPSPSPSEPKVKLEP